MEFKKGSKVVPISKTSRKRELDNCASYYKRMDLKQEFLYVNGVDEESTKQLGETCYWCDAVEGIAGDSYRETDLVLYWEVFL